MTTPGSYAAVGSSTPKAKRARPGRPSSAAKKKKRPAHLRANYTDIAEAVRLLKEENFTIKSAAGAINSRKKAPVPRMTLSDRLCRADPQKTLQLGRPCELPEKVEAALVKCLKMCGEFNYPMKRSDLQDLVQAYCTEHSVQVPYLYGKISWGGGGGIFFVYLGRTFFKVPVTCKSSLSYTGTYINCTFYSFLRLDGPIRGRERGGCANLLGGGDPR